MVTQTALAMTGILILSPPCMVSLAMAQGHEYAIDEAQWWGSLDALWLTRDQGDKKVLAEERIDPAVRPDGGALVSRLTTHSVDFDFQPGVRARLGRALDSRIKVELAYFGLHDWGESAMLINSDPDGDDNPIGLPNRLFSPGLNGSNANLYNVVNRIDIELSSDLHSVELNALQPIGESSANLLLGIRYLRFEDDLTIFADGIDILGEEVNDRTRVRASNDLIGVQAGLGHRFAWRAWSGGISGKVGLFANFNDQQIDQKGITQEGLDVVDLAGDAVSLGQAFDAEVTLRFALTDDFSFQAGYQAFIVNGLALAPDQVGLLGNAANFSVPVRDSSAGTNDSGTVVFHGPHLGLHIRW